MTAVEALNITHRYGRVTAIDDISFNVNEGELFGFIGPDGAGKTTLFRIAATLFIPAGGRMTLFGLNTVSRYRELRNHIGYMPGRFSLYQNLTVEENLNFYATIFGTTIKENYHLIEPIYKRIEPFRKRQAGRLSGGMKQKLALSCALIHKPRILILDEPTTGVDAVSRTEFWEMLARLKSEGITIIVSTPYMDEAPRCDRIALIQNGKLLDIDTPGNIRQSCSHRIFAVRHQKKYELLLALKSVPGVLSREPFGDAMHVSLHPDTTLEQLVRELEAKGLAGVTATEIVPGIEDIFLELMKREA
ncbi:MAG: ABC transporter ATP-binding protein [Bacteroidales bacterium]|nr:ABC transporter ATP-binding protein [Bacteroidales bacterium]MDT8374336.1 ABC transporter ATP-binding protein [Bacteroidales bacterium]